MNVFEEATHKRVMGSVLGLVDIYDDFQEGKIGFEFKNRAFELSSDFVEQSDESDLIEFIKTLSVANKEVRAKVFSQSKVNIHVGILGINKRYRDSEIENLDDTTKERVKAQKWLNMAHSMAKKHSPSIESNTLSSSKAKIAQLITQMDIMRQGIEENCDIQNQNKWGETVYVRDILVDNHKVGAIEYLEDNYSVTILRTDIEKEMQGRGIGFNAYKDFLSKKTRLGKSVGSDNILSKAAQRIYEKLFEHGYYMMESPKYMLSRGDITSIDREDRINQRRHIPTEHIDGVGVAARGYRMKGESIYIIKPSFAPVPCPRINMCELDIQTNKRVETVINPSFIEISTITGKAKDLSDDAHKEIERLLSAARSELKHKNNQYISESLNMDNVLIWKVDRISYEELSKLNKRLNIDIDYTLQEPSL